MRASERESVEQICDRMDGATSQQERESEIARLHASAIRELKAIKDEPGGTVPHPGNVSVADAQHRMHHDGSQQFNVVLTQEPGTNHAQAALELQRRLDRQGFPGVQVLLNRSTNTLRNSGQ